MKFITVTMFDSDVVVLLIAKYFRIEFDQLHVAYGQGKSFCYIPVHDIATSLGEELAQSLLFSILYVAATLCPHSCDIAK